MLRSNVRKKMEENKISMRKLRDETGLAMETINRARRDDMIGKCTLDTLSAIATACKCRIKALFTEPEEDKQPEQSKDI